MAVTGCCEDHVWFCGSGGGLRASVNGGSMIRRVYPLDTHLEDTIRSAKSISGILGMRPDTATTSYAVDHTYFIRYVYGDDGSHRLEQL